MNSVTAAHPRWDEDAVTAAMHRYFAGLDVAQPNWTYVAESPEEARAMRRPCGNVLNDHYVDRVRRRFGAERDQLGASAKAAISEQLDRLGDNTLFVALASVVRDQPLPSDDLFGAHTDVAGAICARAADMSAELLWVWDQILIAFENGLGWYSFVDNGGLILLPQPTMVIPDQRLHRIDGPAVVWPDGTSDYFLEGVALDTALYRRIVDRAMTAEHALALADPDQRLLAIAAAPAGDVLALLGAHHVDTGAKGTSLYRICDHFEPDHDDYCITMVDPSTGRTYLEWVDPEVAEEGDAELCQARLFGIELKDWLALRTEA
ncbi:hypothetical protein C6A86_023485 [Mycobacterium sp. ITM-2016-00316]|uniref:hypothetical protein n=1 Tax=Mycobacterium sp. ITM-2016-00316 TaxID=2099695 RepID=UPI001159C617|nr:hypothetical protein [Mycobacterium sp. ITM-2016-00316]WNG81124.1 hypothetical protein C6A86_023485 [Mycobacterium sp. ITM-2016-00316]